jgi:O-antigen/teichoic acid export membrane protein
MGGILAMTRRPGLRSALSSERLVIHNAIVGGSTLVAGALGFGTQAFLSHRLAPADYGAAFTAISVLALITLPTSALALVVAREASREAADPRFDPRATVMWVWHRYVMLAGLGIAIVGIAGAQWLALFFNVPAAVVVPTAASVPFGLAIPVLLGQLQGRQRFTALSFLLVGQAAFRLILAVGLAARYGAVGAMIGIALGNFLMYAVALATVHPSRAVHFVARAQWRAGLGSLGVILPSSLALAVLLSTDVLLVKHFFGTEEAGRYAAVAALGRIVFWGASGIGMVLFPKAVIHVTRGSNGSPLVMASLAMCLLGGAAVWVTFSLGSGFVLSMFAGGAYVAAGPYLPWYALAMTLFGGATVLVANGQARCNGDFLAVLIPVTVLEPALILRFHQTLMQVVQVLSISMVVLFFGLTVLYLVQERLRERPALMLERATA